ncbi:MAG: HD domain-containing protein [Bacteroidaceae bacterium]|nr:HD domain-containing protein [Bacteroidaceae bacterium]
MDYEPIVSNLAQQVFDALAPRITPEDMERVRKAYLLAKEAHAPQKRKSGEPYILHPIAVALIVAKELQLDANTVITAFLHDVVEDTPYTVEDIRQRFGNDVAGLVNVVTKQKKETYQTTKQVDNYQQILASLHYDIRAVMVKISDRLHNMRTLQSMRPDKQMKIAGETDCFYAPLANRLGLFEVKSDLENLSFKYRCELEYGDIERWLQQDEADNRERLQRFCKNVKGTLKDHGIQCNVETFWRRPYSIWRRMKQQDVDFWHLPNRYYVRITFWDDTLDDPLTEKETCLKIYNLLTRDFRERPGSFINQIEQPKENSYQCLRLMLLSEEGVWEDVQICSEAMVKASQVGCINEIGSNIGNWVKRFRKVLEDIVSQGNEAFFLEHISSSLYYDDITVFSPSGESFILPKDSTVIDYAFKQGDEVGAHAHYAYVNDILCSVKTVLHGGDCVKLITSPDAKPRKDWIDHCQTYLAKRYLRLFLIERRLIRGGVCRCPICKPLPGGEVIGIRMQGIHPHTSEYENITLHRRSCPEAIRMASKFGDNVVSVNYADNAGAPPIEVHSPTSITINRIGFTYPITLAITGVDRHRLLMDLTSEIADRLHLNMDSLCISTKDCIVDCKVTIMVHDVKEMVSAIAHINQIPGIESVRQIKYEK